jgi:hypothetical protein
MPRTYTSPATATLDAIGIDQVAEWIADGKGFRWIAQQAGCTAMTVSRWLRADMVRFARSEEAHLVGADSFEHQAVSILDAAEAAIRADPQIAGAIVGLAKERAQAAWRQASVRDPRRYSDRRTTDIAITVSDTRTIPTAELERLVAQQTLELAPDGTVGGTSD